MNFLMGAIARPLGLILTYLYGLIGNYGITLVVITVAVKLLLYPLYKKQIMSTAGMSDLQPKMQELQRKHADDKETLREKTAELYKESGVNPMGGCLPVVVQMIIIMGLFALLRNPLNFINSENMIFAIHEGFLWIKDLSQPDLWVLPIMAGIATFFSFYMSQQNNAAAMPGGGPGMQKAMMFIFPIMIVWLARSYPAGLSVYWFISQFIQIFYNLRFAQLRKALKEKNTVKTKKARA